jgi:hypothetical protein
LAACDVPLNVDFACSRSEERRGGFGDGMMGATT